MRVGVIGATGLVGERIVRVLEERNFPAEELRLFSSVKSEGKRIVFKDKEYGVEPLQEDSFKGLDIAFFATDPEISREFVPKAKRECIVIDNSSAFRMDKDVPLVVPGVNSEAISSHKNLIANPNCSTIQLVMVLAPLNRRIKIKMVWVGSYQSVSGMGKEALEEFKYQLEVLAMGDRIKAEDVKVFPYPIGGNVIPQIGSFDERGYSTEENKIIRETRKIMGIPKLKISATCVRVPVFFGHSEAVSIEFERKIIKEEVMETLSQTPGIILYKGDKYPMPIDVVDRDEVFVGRIREEGNMIHLWIVADNLRRGAATNAVEIAEEVVKLQNEVI